MGKLRVHGVFHFVLKCCVTDPDLPDSQEGAAKRARTAYTRLAKSFPFPRTGYLKIFWGPNQTAQPSQGLFTPCKGPFFLQNELVTQIILHIDFNQ